MRYVKTMGTGFGTSLDAIFVGSVVYNLEVVNGHVIRGLNLTLLKKET